MEYLGEEKGRHEWTELASVFCYDLGMVPHCQDKRLSTFVLKLKGNFPPRAGLYCQQTSHTKM